MLKIAWSFIVARLKEPSTWRGVITVLTTAGVYIAPRYQEIIVGIGVVLFGGAHFLPDTIGGKDGPFPPGQGGSVPMGPIASPKGKG